MVAESVSPDIGALKSEIEKNPNAVYKNENKNKLATLKIDNPDEFEKLWVDLNWKPPIKDYTKSVIDDYAAKLSSGRVVPPFEMTEDEFNSISVEETSKLEINLEPDNFIMRYMSYGASTCDAYSEYHYTAALSLISIGTNRNVVLRLAQGDLYPNLWIMNLGRSTVSRKSAAAAKYKRFTEDLFPHNALPQSYSPEGFLEELTDKPRSYLIKDEAAGMLEAMEKNYMREMRDIYCTVYDCASYLRKIRSGQRNNQSEFGTKDPFVNMYCATTSEKFSENSRLIDLTSGWLVRFLYTFPTYEKPYMHFKPVSKEDQNLYAEVLSRLSYIKGLFFDRETEFEMQLEPKALLYFQAWQEQREGELVKKRDEIQLAFFGRLVFTALKLAILFTIGQKDYTTGKMVSLAHVQEACRQMDSYFIPLSRIIANRVSMDETKNLQDKILATLNRNGNRLPWKSLMQKIHADKSQLVKAIEALVESDEIEDISVNKVGQKATRWIVLKDLNKLNSQRLKPIRYTETKSSSVIRDSNIREVSKVSTNSGPLPGITINTATHANPSNPSNSIGVLETEVPELTLVPYVLTEEDKKRIDEVTHQDYLKHKPYVNAKEVSLLTELPYASVLPYVKHIRINNKGVRLLDTLTPPKRRRVLEHSLPAKQQINPIPTEQGAMT